MLGRWFRRLLTLLLGLLVAAAVAGWIYSRLALPVTEGELKLPGLGATLRIERDDNGIPTIEAASLRDAMYGLGVVHAQDRLWQMETHRRIGAGRLSEAFGEGALDADRYLHVLGVRRVAEAQWARASPVSRELLTAYTAGVNAVIGSLRARPPEFIILGLQPEPWQPVDSVAWAIMMAVDLGANWDAEVLRLRLSMKMTQQRIDQLLPPYPGDPVPKTIDYAALYRSLGLAGPQSGLDDAVLQRLLAAAPARELGGLGSNSWVLSGARTTTGKPLLANDPHLGLSAPALWYFARLRAPGFDVAGATLPGVPSVVLGQSDHIAWGFTNTGPDVQDTYLERIDPADPTRYQTPDGWARFETRQERIKVKDRPDVMLTVRSTRHGPVLSDAAAAAGLANDVLGPRDHPQFALSLRWTGLDTDNDSVATSLAMVSAKSVDEFIRASRGWVAPMQNMAVADRDGHIALIAAGRVPRRKPDNDIQGLAPSPGWDARYDWDGFLPADVLPQYRDPPKGYLANANQKVVGADYPYFISYQWALPYRYQRIEQLLDARPTHALADLRSIQADVKSLAAQRLLPLLLQVQSTHPLAAAAKAQLVGFDGTMAADRAAPLIFWSWERHLSEQVLSGKVGADIYDRLLGQRGYFDSLESVLAKDDRWWCDATATPAVETCAEQASRAFTAALDELQALQGADPSAWQWGRAHQARSEHRPFSRVAALARWFEVREPVGGDAYTVNAARVSFRADPTSGEYYLDGHGPSMRGLYDLGDRSQSRIIDSTGQSGIPWSPLYRSFADRWRRVVDVPLFVPAGAALKVLVLQPGG